MNNADNREDWFRWLERDHERSEEDAENRRRERDRIEERDTRSRWRRY